VSLVEAQVFQVSCGPIIVKGMHTFDLRPVENGFELRGGQLPEPMVFRDVEPLFRKRIPN
jgi:hypothetical protein